MVFASLFLLQQSAIPELEGAVAALIGGLSLLGLFLGLMLLVLAVVWLLVPFSVFGLKRRLDAILRWQQAIHEELQKISTREGPPGPEA